MLVAIILSCKVFSASRHTPSPPKKCWLTGPWVAGVAYQSNCLVCQNQSIDDSDADLARDLRREVQQQLLTGADDATILDRIRKTYGDYVLLKPPVGV